MAAIYMDVFMRPFTAARLHINFMEYCDECNCPYTCNLRSEFFQLSNFRFYVCNTVFWLPTVIASVLTSIMHTKKTSLKWLVFCLSRSYYKHETITETN